MEMAIKTDHQARSECRLAQAPSYIGPLNRFRGLTRPRGPLLKKAYLYPVGLGHRDPEWDLQGVDSAYLAPSPRPRMAVGSCQLPISATGALFWGAGFFAARAARGVSAGGRAAERGRAWPMGMIGPP